ncbi:DUF6270 domain-containing protein [Brevibacterium yomogidense]|uniref:DUF6270 domain-containing protein n=1 Tax=Brevibacterium yomogidense TaxID=946573 RepID=UPI000B363C47|nr:DUF6270 domain-containing protein [Brevibacterium yomogidense]
MSDKHVPRIDVWGSCVSRDTLEYMPDIAVGTYVARQSAIVSLSPAGDIDVPSDRLGSDFQKRMLEGDRAADVVARLSEPGAALLLLDLVDERRGVWRFPSGAFLTNSVEAYHAGIEVWGPAAGARLIEFGTDEHFELWKRGFTMVVEHVTKLSVPLVFLDIAWAEVSDGQSLPRGVRSVAGTIGRRVKRGTRQMSRSVVRGESLDIAFSGLVSPGHTRAEEIAKVSRRENQRYKRYAAFAERWMTATIRRTSAEVRMNPEHKWGVGPYHYRDTDYEGISSDVRSHLGGILEDD